MLALTTVATCATAAVQAGEAEITLKADAPAAQSAAKPRPTASDITLKQQPTQPTGLLLPAVQKNR